MSDLVKIELPFSGFYESIHDKEIDDAIEYSFQIGDWRESNDDEETGMSDDKEREIFDSIYMADVDWKAIRSEYCENFVEAFGEEFGLHLTFDEVTSPREYNFSTDRVFCKVPREEIDKIRKAVEEHEGYPQWIKDRFTSYDGFWSFYSNDYKDEVWTRETLDECQYRVIIEFWLDNICDSMGSEGWHMEEYYLTNDFEMYNWYSIINAVDTIEKYMKEKK